MTREEVIGTLKEHKIMFQHDFGWDISTIKALDMAISALSENRGEPIYYPPCIDCNKKMDEIRRIYDKLKELPSVENKGEWIPISSINEIPKEGAYWVTFEYENGYRETSHIGWDTFHKHWDDEEGWALDDGDYIIAYMPYFEPKPYNPKGEQ